MEYTYDRGDIHLNGIHNGGALKKSKLIALKNSGNNVIIAYVDRKSLCKNRKWGISKIDDNGYCL